MEDPARDDPATRGRSGDEAAAEGTSRAEASLQSFRDALEKTVTISRDRLQEVLDDAVRRGRITRRDAEELLSRLVSRGREQVEEILAELEDAAGRARHQVGSRVERSRRRTVAAVEKPLAGADRVRRRTGIGFPISAYDQLTIRQIEGRLTELTRDELRKVRSYERRHKARKGVLRSIDRTLRAR